MATAQTVIDAALRLMSIKSPSSGDRDNGLLALNSLLGLLSAQKLVIQQIINESFTLTIGTSSYTIGSGGDFDTVRPTRIVDAWIRNSNDRDYPVELMTRERYNDIEIKTIETRPDRLYYATEYSLGKIYFNTEPSAAETLYIDSWKPLTALAALGTTVDLPPEYEDFLILTLAVRYAPEKSVVMVPTVYVDAKEAKKVIKSLNAEPQLEVKMERAITYQPIRGGNIY